MSKVKTILSFFGIPIIIEKEVIKIEYEYIPDRNIKKGDKIFVAWLDNPEIGNATSSAFTGGNAFEGMKSFITYENKYGIEKVTALRNVSRIQD